MKTELTGEEARIIGCLIEKQLTTPDQYPLSLNALVNACNQKSNRDPVVAFDEPTVQRTVDALVRKHLVVERSGFGSRVPKYQHRFCNTEFGTLKFDPQELAVVCELLLRGPQTPGELRSRAARMAPFQDVSETEATLTKLQQREDGPFVVRLAREPGRRESRYAHLFSGAPPAGLAEPVPFTDSRSASPASGPQSGSHSGEAASAQASAGAFPHSHYEERLARVEEEVRSLRAQLEELKGRLA